MRIKVQVTGYDQRGIDLNDCIGYIDGYVVLNEKPYAMVAIMGGIHNVEIWQLIIVK